MALDDYFSDPSQDCLARLFDAVNSMDISMAPILTRYEKLIMRTSERKDVFIEKFEDLGRPHVSDASASQNHAHKTNDSVGSHSSFEEGILIRMEKDRGKESDKKGPASSTTSLHPSTQSTQYSPSDASFSLDGSAVWVDSGADQTFGYPGTSVGSNGAGGSSRSESLRGRKSTDASSSSSHNYRGDRSGAITPSANAAGPVLKDTHFFPATIDYNDHQLPIRLPLSTFPEEVGDVRNNSLSHPNPF